MFPLKEKAGDSNHRAAMVIAVLSLLLAPFGCLAPTETAHEEEEPHARPAYMPISFVEAIPDLARRLEAVKKAASEKRPPSKESLNEFRDIVGWLPLLAGESDLRQADWDSVNELSVRMEKLVAPWSAETPGVLSVDAEFDIILESLQRLAAKAKAAGEADWQ